ncbi:MAG: SRPBCC family protein [Deltaproteobacteria bacterium]|nr:SRPBCC family protein [Deltaproteobacteria bacterium]
MAEASKTIVMEAPRDRIWEVIVDYQQYPEFVDGAQRVKIISRDVGKARIEYGIQLLGKDITYTLDHFEDGPGSMRWELIESNILKGNTGSWKLKDLGGGRTEVTYSLGLDFKIYVPGMILNGLVKSSLPKMLESFEKRTKKVMSSHG